MRKKIPKTVGSIIVYDDDDNEWSMKWAIEQDYGKNCNGEEGLFYLNQAAANSDFETDKRVYYMPTVPGGYIEATDPNFYKYAYTYKKLYQLCNNNGAFFNEVLGLLCGQDPKEVIEVVRKRWREHSKKRRKDD